MKTLQDYMIFLDDERFPGPAYESQEMVIVRNFWDFKKILVEMGIPKFITFDHDLADTHYTGYTCAEFLISEMIFSENANISEEFSFEVHSMNPVGAQKIRDLLNHELPLIKEYV